MKTTQPKDQGKQKGRRSNGEGTQLTDGRWQVRLQAPDGKMKVFYGKTKKDAQQKRDEARLALKKGEPIPSGRKTFGQLLDEWLDVIVKPHVRPMVYHNYESCVRLHLKPILGKTRLAKLTAMDFDTLYAMKAAEGLAPRTIRRIHAVARNAMNVALGWEMVTKNVVSKANPPAEPDGEYVTLDPEEAVRMLACVRGHKLECIVTLALTTGLREAELLGLHWEEVDFAGELLKIRRQVQRVPREGFTELPPKSKKGIRKIRLTSIGIEALRRQRERVDEMRIAAGERWDERGLVHPNRYGRPIEKQNLTQRNWKPFLERNGFRDMRFHDLRHSTATLLFRLGVPMKVIQSILGHSTISVTSDIYTSEVQELQDAAMAALNDFLTPAKSSTASTTASAEPIPLRPLINQHKIRGLD